MNKKKSSKEIGIFLEKNCLCIAGIFFLLLMTINLFVYYKYIYLVVNTSLESEIEEMVIEQDTLQKVLDNVTLREDNLKRIQKSQYKDPF